MSNPDSLPPTVSLVELLLEQREAWEKKEPLSVEQILARHPSFREDSDAILDLIYNEIILREERGEVPQLAEYLVRFPDLAEPLRLQFEVDQAISVESSLSGRESLPPTLLAPPDGIASAAEGTNYPVLPGCEVLSELGRGAMGIVYRAWQMGPNRIVALKVLHPDVPLARVRTEAEAAARLQDPHIVQVFEVKEHAGRTAIVLEFVEGGNLAQKIDGKPQPPREAARLVQTLARATDYAHGKGVVHRDLKPSNVLLAGSLDAPLAVCAPKISDFGLAKLLTGGSRLTHTTDILGTPSYMAPEQAEGGTVGIAADLYSLGAILYELLTGRPPFVGENVLDTLAQVKNQDPVPPRRLQPRVPRDLETITLKCLHKHATRRYGSALELADDLQAFLEGRPISARPAGPIERLVKWARRQPALATLLSVCLAAGLVGLAGGLHFTQQVRQQRDLAESRAEEIQQQLDRTRKLLCTAQLLRVGAVWESDPLQALQLLEDETACPVDLRDFTWNVFFNRCKRYRLDLAGHTRKVAALVYRPDGEVLASGGHDGTINLWNPNPAPGQSPLLASLHEHTSRVTALAYNPAGNTLASGSSDGVVLLWESLSTGDRPTATLAGKVLGKLKGRVTGLVFLPDGLTLAINSGQPEQAGMVSLWDVRTCKLRTQFPEPTGPGSPLVLSPDGTNLACAGNDNDVWLWETNTGKVRQHLKGHTHAVLALAFSPDGQTLATGDTEKNIRLWNLSSGENLATLDSENGAIAALAYSSDGQTLAVAGENPLAPFGSDSPRGVVLWDVLQRKPRELLRGHRNPVAALAFSPDGRSLASAGQDKNIKIWNVRGRPYRIELDRHAGGLSSVALSADGNTLAWISRVEEDRARERDGRALEITVLDVVTGRIRARLKGHTRPVLCLALSPDGNTLASAAGGGDDPVELKVWDVSTGQEARSLVGHSALVQALAFSPDSRTLASGGWDRTVRLWDLTTGTSRRLQGPTRRITCLSFSPDGRTLVAGCGSSPAGETGEVYLWDPASEVAQQKLTPPSWVSCVTFSASGKVLGVGGQDGSVRLYEVGSELEPRVIQPGVKPLHYLALHPDGKTLALAGVGNSVKLWDLDVMQERAGLAGHPGGVCYLAFSRDGRVLVSASAAHVARLWYASADSGVRESR